MFQTVRTCPEKQPAYKTLIWAIKVGPVANNYQSESFETSAYLLYKSENRLVHDGFCRANFGVRSMVPEASSFSQLSQVISQAAAPAFILAALAAFTALLIARQNRIVDRTIVLNAISGDSVKERLKADLPRLMRRAAMLNRAILWAVISSIAITVLVIVAFVSALLHIQHEVGVAILFIVALLAFTIALVEFAREVRIALNELDHYG